jgi:hypothetical protein
MGKNFADGFQNVLMLKKSKSKFLLSSLKLLTNFESLSVTLSETLERLELALESIYVQEAVCDPVKSY